MFQDGGDQRFRCWRSTRTSLQSTEPAWIAGRRASPRVMWRYVKMKGMPVGACAACNYSGDSAFLESGVSQSAPIKDSRFRIHQQQCKQRRARGHGSRAIKGNQWHIALRCTEVDWAFYDAGCCLRVPEDSSVVMQRMICMLCMGMWPVRRVQIKSGDFDTMGYDWSVSSCITLRGDQCITPRPSGEAWWCEHPAVAYHCRSLATVRQPKSLRLPAQKCEKHFKTQYINGQICWCHSQGVQDVHV
jgi:hypothetical protein